MTEGEGTTTALDVKGHAMKEEATTKTEVRETVQGEIVEREKGTTDEETRNEDGREEEAIVMRGQREETHGTEEDEMIELNN